MSTQTDLPEVALTGVSATTTAGSVFVKARENLSVSHLLASATFSRTVGSLQSEHAGEPFGAFWQDIQSHAIGSILTAIAGLEAYANELFVDYAQVFPALPNAVMSKLWELYEMKSTLEKFDFPLLLLGAEPFDKGASPYQDITALTKLRNALVHFKPEWSDQQVEHAKISSMLTARVDRSPFFGSSEPLFPTAWAGHSATVWAVRSVTSFVLDFERRAKLPSRLQPFLARLNAL